MDLLFSPKHFMAIGIGIVVIIGVSILLNKTKWESRKLIIYTALTFYVFEILKQGFWIFSGIFSVHKLPLYPCNMPLYIFPLLIFGNEKTREFIKPFLYVIFLGGGLLSLIYPSIILGTSDTWTVEMSNFVPIISVIVHSLMIGIGLYLLNTGYYKIKNNDYIRIFTSIFTMYLLVYVFNQIFGTDFFFSNIGQGLPEFLVALKDVSELLFVSLVFISGLMVLYIVYWITLLVNRKFDFRYSHKEL